MVRYLVQSQVAYGRVGQGWVECSKIGWFKVGYSKVCQVSVEKCRPSQGKDSEEYPRIVQCGKPYDRAEKRHHVLTANRACRANSTYINMYDKFKSLLKDHQAALPKARGVTKHGGGGRGLSVAHTESRQSGGGAGRRLSRTANYELHEKYTRPRLKLRASRKRKCSKKNYWKMLCRTP